MDPMDSPDQNLSLSFNLLDFIATDLRIKIYEQAHSFSVISLNTTVLGLGPEKDYDGLAGAPLGTTAAVWIVGRGFLNFAPEQNVQQCSFGYGADGQGKSGVLRCGHK